MNCQCEESLAPLLSISTTDEGDGLVCRKSRRLGGWEELGD